MRSKQEWVITVRLTETEGDETTTRPWYDNSDVDALIWAALKLRGIRDLELRSVTSLQEGNPYL